MIEMKTIKGNPTTFAAESAIGTVTGFASPGVAAWFETLVDDLIKQRSYRTGATPGECVAHFAYIAAL